MATRPLPEVADSRFAPYIKELRESFATSGVRFGVPEDIAGIMDRLRVPGTFSDDLSSLVRSFVLRQGGAMPHAQLMEILSFAIAGPEMARSPQQYREPLRELLAFVSGVMRRPWNVPPGERIDAEIVPFPIDTGMRTAELEPIPGIGAAAEIATLTEIEAEPLLSRLAPTPIDLREPMAEAATPPLVPNDPLPPHTPSDPGPPPAPNPALNALPEAFAPMSAISAALVAESDRVATPHQPIHQPIQPIARAPEPESTLHPMLRPIPATAAPHPNNSDAHRRSTVPRDILLASAAGLLLTAVLVVANRARKPDVVYTVQPVASSHSTNSPVSQLNSASPPQTFSSGSAGEQYASGTASQPQPSADGQQLTGRALRHARQLAAAAADEDIAEPYSSAPEYAPSRVFGKASATAQPVAGTAHPAPLPVEPQQQPTTATYAPYNGGGNGASNSGAPTQAPAPIVRETVRRPVPRDPDATIAGDSPAGTQSSFNAPGRTAYITVASGVMASNLISSPEPGYPMIARIAHVQGQVILQATIAKDGSVSTTRVLRGNRLLRGAAEDAVRRRRYRPYRVNGRAVDVATIVTVDFHNGAAGGGASGSAPH